MRKDEFTRRRRQLMKTMGKGGIAILPAVPEKARNGDVKYHYRPDSDFFYLTGFAEPEAVAVLIPGRSHAEYVLFVRERDPARETWDGRRAGPEGVTRDYGADDAFPIGEINRNTREGAVFFAVLAAQTWRVRPASTCGASFREHRGLE